MRIVDEAMDSPTEPLPLPLVVGLCCVVINNQRRVLSGPFQLTVPRDATYKTIFAHLRFAAPSLRRGEVYSISGLYKPLSTIPSGKLTQLDETQVDLNAHVRATAQDLKKPSPGGDTNRVDVIICVSAQGTFLPTGQ